MRTTRNLARRSSALVLAGALAFAGAACGGDDGEDTDVEVTEDTGATETEMGSTETETSTETDMGSTETETSTE